MSEMKLATKVMMAVGMIAMLALVLGGVAYLKFGSVEKTSNEASLVRSPSLVALLEIANSESQVLASERGLLIRRMFKDPDIRAAQKNFTAKAFDTIDKQWKIYEPLEQTKDEKALWDQFVPVFNDWKKSNADFLGIVARKEQIMNAMDKEDPKLFEEKIADVDNEMFAQSLVSRKFYLAQNELLQKLVNTNEEMLGVAVKSQTETISGAKSVLIGTLIMVMMLAIGTGLFFSRHVKGLLMKVQHEFERVRDAAAQGRLATRGDTDSVHSEFRFLVEGTNDILDKVIGPLNVAALYVDRISKGDIPAKITDSYNGDFNEIKNNLNQCIDAVNMMTTDASMLAKAAVEGRLATRADATKHQGDFRKIVAGVNDTLDAVINPLNVAALYVDRISKGDIPAKITDSYNGDFNEIKNNLNQCIDAVNMMTTDASMLAKAAVEGRLATRADATKHQGDFKKIVAGVNDTLDAVINPLNVAAKYVDRISKGDIPAKITDSYNGDFNEIKNNLNQCIDAVNMMTTDASMLAKAAVEGRLATRADATKHQGDFKKIVAGVNDTLDAVINPLNVAAKYVDRISKGDIPAKITDSYNGDFNEIKNNLNQCIDAVNMMTTDASMLAKAAVEGRLATRADATKHQGDFKKIVAGVNDTLDAVINPLNVAALYVDRISKGDIPAKITGLLQRRLQ